MQSLSVQAETDCDIELTVTDVRGSRSVFAFVYFFHADRVTVVM